MRMTRVVFGTALLFMLFMAPSGPSTAFAAKPIPFSDWSIVIDPVTCDATVTFTWDNFRVEAIGGIIYLLDPVVVPTPNTGFKNLQFKGARSGERVARI